MTSKLKSQLLWAPPFISYFLLPSPFGWYAMLALILYSFSQTVLCLIIVKTVDPCDRQYEFSAFNECKTDVLDWIIFASTFSACMACRDFFLAAGIVSIIYVELEIFRITGQVS